MANQRSGSTRGNRRGERGSGAWRDTRFWDEVRDEMNVETMRWNDFAAFVSPAGSTRGPDFEFEVELREHLRGLVRKLYTS